MSVVSVSKQLGWRSAFWLAVTLGVSFPSYDTVWPFRPPSSAIRPSKFTISLEQCILPVQENHFFLPFIYFYMRGEMLDWKIGNMASTNFGFLHELEDWSELRGVSCFEGSFNETMSEEGDCFFGVEAVANLGSLDGNHLEDGQEYFR